MHRSIASISVPIDEVCSMGLAQDSYRTTERRNVQSVLSLLILSPAVIRGGPERGRIGRAVCYQERYQSKTRHETN